jgi:hypothetical protein
LNRIFARDQIVDIGLGGLTFNWVDRGKPLSNRFEIDLFLDGKLYLEKVKAKLISNMKSEPFHTVPKIFVASASNF